MSRFRLGSGVRAARGFRERTISGSGSVRRARVSTGQPGRPSGATRGCSRRAGVLHCGRSMLASRRTGRRAHAGRDHQSVGGHNAHPPPGPDPRHCPDRHRRRRAGRAGRRPAAADDRARPVVARSRRWSRAEPGRQPGRVHGDALRPRHVQVEDRHLGWCRWRAASRGGSSRRRRAATARPRGHRTAAGWRSSRAVAARRRSR